MKILYGINGEGLGHFNRSSLVIKELKNLGHEVKTASFNNFFSKIDIIIPGIKLSLNKSGVEKIKLFKDFLTFNKNTSIDYYPDIIISDFEPVVANFGRKNNIPVISIDNQHRFDYLDRKLPIKLFVYNIFLKMVNKLFIGNINDKIITCFYDIPGAISPIVRNLEKIGSEYNVIYVKDSTFKDIEKDLNEDLYVLFSNSTEIKETRKFIKFPITDSYYKLLLSMSKKVISNAGHQTISECLCYNIPLVSYPIKNQPEQLINHYYLNKTKSISNNGISQCMERLEKWLK